jgi:nucleoid-associated protein YgaU
VRQGEGVPGTPARQAEGLPAFDVVRVEPNGDTVIAGRAAPNTTVEMLVGDKSVARALADPNGQFAIVPPALPTGNSEIVLRTTGADGRETRSKQSVAVVVAETRDTKPLVALTDPDKPTVVLSQPETAAGEPQAVASAPMPGQAVGAAAGPKPAEPAQKAAEAKPGAADPVKIVSVDAQDGGRLYVTSQAAPGSTLRLYLNDTLVAPASAGPDGKVTFTIGRGVRAGDYRVRIDQVDPVTGKVRHRAEVPFAFPALTPKVAVRELPAPTEPPRSGSRPVAAMALPGSKPDAVTPPRRAGEPRADARQATPAGQSAPPNALGTTPAAAPAPEAAVEAIKPPAALIPAPPDTPRDVFVAEVSTAKITRGDSLWQISRRTYGKGDRYTVIYDANQGQIRDPDLIFPGQIFVLPTDDASRASGRRG